MPHIAGELLRVDTPLRLALRDRRFLRPALSRCAAYDTRTSTRRCSSRPRRSSASLQRAPPPRAKAAEAAPYDDSFSFDEMLTAHHVLSHVIRNSKRMRLDGTWHGLGDASLDGDRDGDSDGETAAAYRHDVTSVARHMQVGGGARASEFLSLSERSRGSSREPTGPRLRAARARAQFLVSVHVFELCSEPPAPALPARPATPTTPAAGGARQRGQAMRSRARCVRFVCPFLRRIVLDTFPAATREQWPMLRRAIARPRARRARRCGRLGPAETVGSRSARATSDADGAGEPGADRAVSSGFFGCAIPGVN